jgi:hypothetical protein
MSYHVTLQPRHSEISVSYAQLLQAIQEETGATPEIDTDGDTIHVNSKSGEWIFSIFLTDGEWWAERLRKLELDMFTQIANHMACHVKGDEGEIYRYVDGESKMIKAPDAIPHVTIWKKYNWYPLAALTAISVLYAILRRFFFQ